MPETLVVPQCPNPVSSHEPPILLMYHMCQPFMLFDLRLEGLNLHSVPIQPLKV